MNTSGLAQDGAKPSTPLSALAFGADLKSPGLATCLRELARIAGGEGLPGLSGQTILRPVNQVEKADWLYLLSPATIVCRSRHLRSRVSQTPGGFMPARPALEELAGYSSVLRLLRKRLETPLAQSGLFERSCRDRVEVFWGTALRFSRLSLKDMLPAWRTRPDGCASGPYHHTWANLEQWRLPWTPCPWPKFLWPPGLSLRIAQRPHCERHGAVATVSPSLTPMTVLLDQPCLPADCVPLRQRRAHLARLVEQSPWSDSLWLQPWAWRLVD